MQRTHITLAAALLSAAPAFAQAAPPVCAGLPPGRHALLERMTAQFGLSCEQELKIEPLLHDEESVTKPLLNFTSFTREQQQEVMLTIKLAARRQVRQFLTADQQKSMDAEVESVSKSGGKKKDTKTADVVPSLEVEEELSGAIVKYAALNANEKKAMLVKVKAAARKDAALQLTAEQQAKLDSEIRNLEK
jgi:hypothetical protein